MNEQQPISPGANVPHGKPEMPATGNVPAESNPTEAVQEPHQAEAQGMPSHPIMTDTQTPDVGKDTSSMKPATAESPAGEKPTHGKEAPEAGEQRAATRMENIVSHTKTYLSDMRLAYLVAGQRLGGQSVTGKILEGATVTGVGIGLEFVVQEAFSAALGELLGHIRSLGKADGILRIEKRLPEEKGIAGGVRIFKSQIFQESIDKDGKPITNIRMNLRRLLEEKLKADKSGFRMHVVNSLMEGFDDTAVLIMYGIMNRLMGNMLPRIPTEYLGTSVALDFLGIGQSPDGTKKNGETSQPVAPDTAQAKGLRAGLTKGVEFGQKVFNFSNPVSLYGLSVMKSGATTYLDTLKAIRDKRKEYESGKGSHVYVGEGAPRDYRQEYRPREQRRDGGYRGRQGRGGRQRG